MTNGLVPDIGGQLGRGLQTFGGLQQQQLQRQQLEAQQAALVQQQAERAAVLGGGVPQAQGLPVPSAGLPALGPAPIAGPPDPLRPDAIQAGPTGIVNQEALQRLAVTQPDAFKQIGANLGLITQTQKDEAADFAFSLQNTPFEQREGLIRDRVRRLRSEGRNASDTASLSNLNELQQNSALNVVRGLALTPETRQEREEKRRKATAEGEVVSEVQRSTILPGGLVQLVRKDGTVETIPANEADETLIQAAEQRGAELQGLRAGERGAAKESIKQGAKAFEDSVKIRKNVRNLNEGIRLIDGGAKTGRVEKLLPSIRTASIELDNLQQRLGLDVIGSVTFGALSEGELALALSTALPTGLDEPALRNWLVRKRDAQTKLLAEVEDAAVFLSDPNNNITDFIARKKDVGVTAQPSGPIQVGRFTVEAE